MNAAEPEVQGWLIEQTLTLLSVLEIIKLKKEKKICILAHAYQSNDILEIADYVGDSFGLSRQAETAEEDTVIMCGVEFMAETVKILSPEKKVILANEFVFFVNKWRKIITSHYINLC